jgi:hypothetical protein
MWYVIMRDRDDKQRARLMSELYLPLPGQNIKPDDVQYGPWSDAEMAASFTTFKSELGDVAR